MALTSKYARPVVPLDLNEELVGHTQSSDFEVCFDLNNYLSAVHIASANRFSVLVSALTNSPIISARAVFLEKFLTPSELSTLLEFTLGRESDFEPAHIVRPSDNHAISDRSHRRAKVLHNTGIYNDLIVGRILQSFTKVLEGLNHPHFSVSSVEARITASNDGDYFRRHSDNSQDSIRTREISFVYYFYCEPKAFTGGELRLYDTRLFGENYIAADVFQTILPRQNEIVFFPSLLKHEVLEIHCSSRAFRDSRFTFNGWFRKQ